MRKQPIFIYRITNKFVHIKKILFTKVNYLLAEAVESYMINIIILYS